MIGDTLALFVIDCRLLMCGYGRLINIIYGNVSCTKHLSESFNAYNDILSLCLLGNVVPFASVVDSVTIYIEQCTSFGDGYISVLANPGIFDFINMFLGIQGSIPGLFLFLGNFIPLGKAVYGLYRHFVDFLDLFDCVPLCYFFSFLISQLPEIAVNMFHTEQPLS